MRPSQQLWEAYGRPLWEAGSAGRPTLAAQCRAKLRLRPTREERLATEPVRSSKWAKHRGPRAAVRPDDANSALGPSSAECVVAVKLDASAQSSRPQPARVATRRAAEPEPDDERACETTCAVIAKGPRSRVFSTKSAPDRAKSVTLRGAREAQEADNVARPGGGLRHLVS